MKAILIDPAARSIQYVEIAGETDREQNPQIKQLVGENEIDVYVVPLAAHMVVVGEHSALQIPPLPKFMLFDQIFFGRALIFGMSVIGATLPLQITIEKVSVLIDFE